MCHDRRNLYVLGGHQHGDFLRSLEEKQRRHVLTARFTEANYEKYAEKGYSAPAESQEVGGPRRAAPIGQELSPHPSPPKATLHWGKGRGPNIAHAAFAACSKLRFLPIFAGFSGAVSVFWEFLLRFSRLMRLLLVLCGNVIIILNVKLVREPHIVKNRFFG